jgi:elongation factor Ts
MAEISAAAVKSFRERTGLPLMDCKKALSDAGGDENLAIELLRKEGKKLNDKRSDRETSFGRFGIYAGVDKSVTAMVELKCESAPVASNEEFVQLAQDLAHVLATGPGASTADELLAQKSPSKPGMTLGEQRDELFNRIREVFNVGRMIRLNGGAGGYSHNSGTIAGVLVGVDGGNDTAAKDVAMHVAAMRPESVTSEDLDPALIAKEREILKAAALNEGKPEAIVDKMVEGRLKQYFAEKCLLDQPFVKDDKMSVSQFAKQHGMKVKSFTHWVMSQST